MRCVFAILLLSSACAGPSQKTLAETPTATTKRTPAEAPPASGPEKERASAIGAMDSETDATNAHREAAGEAPLALPPAPGSVPGAKPKTKPVQPK